MTDPNSQPSPADESPGDRTGTPDEARQADEAQGPSPEGHAPARPERAPAPGQGGTSPPKAAGRDDADDEYETVDIYTAEITCKCGKQIAANAWFCPRCGRVYLMNMLFALVVLAAGFALLNQVVQWVLAWLSRAKR